jgi:hypothetical protein
MQVSTTRETISCAVNRDLPSTLWSPKAHHRIHKSPPLVSILRQTNPFHTTPSYLLKIQLLLLLPNLMSIFRSLGRLPKESVQVRGSVKYFVTILYFTARGFSRTPNPQFGDHSLSAVRGYLFNMFAATFHRWKPSPSSATRRCALS